MKNVIFLVNFTTQPGALLYFGYIKFKHNFKQLLLMYIDYSSSVNILIEKYPVFQIKC